MLFGVLSSFFGALNGVYIKKSFQVLKNLWELNFLLNIISTVTLVPVIYMCNEHERISQFPYLMSFNFWNALCLSGLLGFLVGLAVSFLIQMTSPLTANISGVAKSCIQTIIGVIYFNESKTFIWWSSNMLVLLGAASYSIIRNKETQTHKTKIIV